MRLLGEHILALDDNAATPPPPLAAKPSGRLTLLRSATSKPRLPLGHSAPADGSKAANGESAGTTATTANALTFMYCEISQHQIRIRPFAMGRLYHVYTSTHNAGAELVGEELTKLVAQRAVSYSRAEVQLHVTDDFENLAACEHMLLYLTSETWTRGAASAALAHEVCEAQRAGVHLLLAHEFPSNLGDNEARKACAFDHFWNEGWTPKWLLTGEANVRLATPPPPNRSQPPCRKWHSCNPCRKVACSHGLLGPCRKCVALTR